MPSLKNIPKYTALGLIRGYQYGISPLLGPRCRFYPTCSCYAVEAVERFGVVKGGILAMMRIAKCGPFHPGGVDPVPETFSLLRHKQNHGL